MPRKLRARPKKKPVRKKTNSEPLAEGIVVPMDSRGRRSWKSMSDDEIVEYAKNLMKKKGIKSTGELQKEDGGLYGTLLKRKILERLGLKKRRRRPCTFFSRMSNDELVEYAKNFMKEKGIKSRGGLAKEDRGLYFALWERKLLDLVFSDIEKAKEKQAVQDVFDALREFGGPG